MDSEMLEVTLKVSIAEMSVRLGNAASIARAANACAEAGNIEKAIQVAMDVEQLTYEANTLLNAASLIYRIASK
jgi:hypothetical protein